MSDLHSDRWRRGADQHATDAEHDEGHHGEQQPQFSLAQGLQRTLGNSRLIQMRSVSPRPAIQRKTEDILPDWVKQRMANEAAQEELENQGSQVTIPSGGKPLPPTVQKRAEGHLGVGLDDVRVVTNGDSATKPIQAQAFTTDNGGTPTVVLGNDVNLNSRDGQFTLMHELTHVKQQKQGMAGGLSGLGGDAGQRESMEQHADSHAERMCSDPTHHH